MTETAEKTAQNKRGSGVAVAEGVVSNGRGGRFVSSGNLTEKQAAFVRLYVSNGGDKRNAAELAGYTHGYPVQEASRLLRDEKIQDALRKERARYIGSELAGLALNTMKDLMEDKATPAATRFNAAKWSLETAGHGQKETGLPDPDKSLSDMSLQELETFIRAGREALDRPVIEGETASGQQDDDTAEDADWEPADSGSAQDTARVEDMLRVSD